MGDEDSGPVGPLTEMQERLYRERDSFDLASFVFGLTIGATFTALVVILVIAVVGAA